MQSPPERPVYLLGESFGGVMALAVAEARPDLVRPSEFSPASSLFRMCHRCALLLPLHQAHLQIGCAGAGRCTLALTLDGLLVGGLCQGLQNVACMGFQYTVEHRMRLFEVTLYRDSVALAFLGAALLS